MSDGEVQGEAQLEQLDAVEATNAFCAVRPCLHTVTLQRMQV